MTDKTISVDVEWALHGKTRDRPNSHVLACSNGHPSVADFTEVIGRFSISTPDKLPHVAVSYVTSGDGPGRAYHLAMAIHQWAADVETDGGELLEVDDYGRAVKVTSYLCVPYLPLAAAAVSYRALYREFNALPLPTSGGPPLRVEFPTRSSPPAIGALAMQSAGRLLTRRPVCVLGAESATVAERLEFIDAVAALLPYGFRTRLAAATWVHSILQRQHRFRLFFSDAKRDADPPDDVVYWGNPERTALTTHDDHAYVYDQWLAGTGGQLEVLARLTTPRSFSRGEVLESLAEIGSPFPGPDETDEPGSRPVASDLEPLPRFSITLPASTLPASRTVKLDVDHLLRECASYMQTRQLADLNTAVTRLKGQARSRTSPEDQDRYRKLIREQRLFRHVEGLDKMEGKLRETLLKVAFTSPLTYPDYCLIEDSADTEPLDQPLLRLIETGMFVMDLRIRPIVYAQLQERDIKRKLYDWYTSVKVTAFEMVNVLAGHWHRPRHMFYASVVTADLMEQISCDSSLVRKALQQHSYLAQLLQIAGTGRDNRQTSVLSTFLRTAYPDRLSKKDVRQVLMENAEPPSPALLVAVLLNLAHPRDAQLAQKAYAIRTTQAMNLLPETHEVLRPLLAFTGEQPADSASSHTPNLEPSYRIEP